MDTHNESELIILENGRQGPIYERLIGRKSNATAYQLAKVKPLKSKAQISSSDGIIWGGEM